MIKAVRLVLLQALSVNQANTKTLGFSYLICKFADQLENLLVKLARGEGSKPSYRVFSVPSLSCAQGPFS